uniref:Uncharacterized protein n=1 Tax=Nelumbo nucifera TaxID=4432 RepID=A0A822YNR1_NELNU|nr:TPA_asm: hypothetical protein HUJ06_004797 [Nelumbo nucifera]
MYKRCFTTVSKSYLKAIHESTDKSKNNSSLIVSKTVYRNTIKQLELPIVIN